MQTSSSWQYNPSLFFTIIVPNTKLNYNKEIVDKVLMQTHNRSCHFVSIWFCLYSIFYLADPIDPIQVGEGGKAVGIDHIPELVEMARANIKSDSPELLESGTIELVGKSQGAFAIPCIEQGGFPHFPLTGRTQKYVSLKLLLWLLSSISFNIL